LGKSWYRQGDSGQYLGHRILRARTTTPAGGVHAVGAAAHYKGAGQVVRGQYVTTPIEYRRVTANKLVIGQFAVFQSDGFNKVTGLTPPDQIVITVYQDGGIVSVPVEVTEIGSTGEYKFSFTPTAPGTWQVEFKMPTQQQLVKADYDVVLQDIGALPGQKFIDRVTDGFGNGVQYATVNVFQSSTSTLLASVETDYLGNYEIDLVGPLADPILVDLQFVGTGIRTYMKRGIRLV
jgi:hypothetical protein